MMPNMTQPEYATKQDLELLRQQIRADLADQLRALESSFNKTVIMALLGATGIFGTLITVLKLFA